MPELGPYASSRDAWRLWAARALGARASRLRSRQFRAFRACRHDDSFTPLAKALADNAAQIEKVCSRSRLGGDGRLPCNRVRWGLHPALGPHAVALFVAQELIDCQGPAVDLGGYWQPDPAKVKAAMNPSPTLNKILTDMA